MYQFEKVSKGVGMNSYWNHEPEFFWYKKKSEKVRNFWLRGQTPPPRVDFLKKFLTSFFYGPLRKSYSKLSLGMWCKVSLVKFNHAWSIPHEDMNVIGAIVGIFQSFFSHSVFETEIWFKWFLELEIAKIWKKFKFFEIYVKFIANWGWVCDVRLV